MNDREKKFCEAYLSLGNATKAAVQAGYALSTAKDACKWIDPVNPKKPDDKFKPSLQEYVDRRRKELESKKTASPEEITQYLTSVLRGESESEAVVVVGVGEGCSEPVKVTKKPDEKEKLSAADKLARILGLYQNRIDMAGALPIVITGADQLED